MYLNISPLTSGKLSKLEAVARIIADIFQQFLAVFQRKEKLEKRPAVRASTGPCDSLH